MWRGAQRVCKECADGYMESVQRVHGDCMKGCAEKSMEGYAEGCMKRCVEGCMEG